MKEKMKKFGAWLIAAALAFAGTAAMAAEDEVSVRIGETVTQDSFPNAFKGETEGAEITFLKPIDTSVMGYSSMFGKTVDLNGQSFSTESTEPMGCFGGEWVFKDSKGGEGINLTKAATKIIKVNDASVTVASGKYSVGADVNSCLFYVTFPKKVNRTRDTELVITGGTFIGDIVKFDVSRLYTYGIYEEDEEESYCNQSVRISGGTFSAEPNDAWIVSGHKKVQNASTGYWSVVPDIPAVAKIAETGVTYPTLQAAFTEMKSGETVELLCDVDLKSEPWTPVPLKGGFDGKGFKISNLVVNQPEQNGVGFFSNQTTRKAVKDVEFINVDIKGLCNVGAIFGYNCFGPVENVKVSGTIKVEAMGGDNYGYTRAGVMCGGWSYAAYTNVTVNGGDKAVSYVKGPKTGVDGRYVAGFVGHLDEDGYFANCTVKNLTVDGKYMTAGFCGDGPGRVCTGCTVENVDLKAAYSGALFSWLFSYGDDPALVENATIRNVTFADKFECGTVAQYTEDGDAGAIVKNVTIEGVAPLKYNYQVYVTENGDNFHYANILAAVSDPEIDDLSVITVASDKIEVPSGYELYVKDGLWGVRKLSPVVRVGANEYSSIEVALANSSGDVEMTLIGNATCGRVTLSDADDPQVKSLMIDLNGFTLTDNGGDALLTKDRTITIRDSVGTGNFVHTSTDDFVWLQGTKGGIILESGKYVLAESYSYGFAYPANLKEMLVVRGGTYNVDLSNYKNVNYLPDGYESIDNGDGTWTVQESAICQILETGVKYPTLQAAFDAAGANETVVLLVDVTSAMNEAYTVAAGKLIMLDLNGKVLSGGNDKTTGFAYLTNCGTLTLKDSSTEGTGKITSKTYPDTGNCPGFHTVLNKGTFVMESGTIEEASEKVGGGNNLKWAFRNEASQNQKVSATIKGGLIVGNYNAISDYVYDDSSDCTLNIEGGVIKTTGRFSVVTLQSASASKPKFHINISGGEFIVENRINTNPNGNAIFYCDGQANANADFTGCFKITGGKFNTFNTPMIAEFTADAGTPTPDTKFMTAGLSKCEIPQESIADGYVCANNTDEATKDDYPWTVQKKSEEEINVPTDEAGEAVIPVKIPTEVFEQKPGQEIVDKDGKPLPAPATKEEKQQFLVAEQPNGLKVWQNVAMGVDGNTAENALATISREPTAEEKAEAEKVGKTVDIVINTPISEFDPPKTTGVTVSYKLLRSTDGGVTWTVVDENLEKPEFPTYTKDDTLISEGDTFWKFQAVFTSQANEEAE